MTLSIGLFKVEWSGRGFIGLAAKTYFCYGDNGDKCSTKGINKSALVSREHFLNVLRTKDPHTSINRGFILKNNVMLSYEMERQGLTFLYVKRKVLEDGIRTTHLDI